MRVLMLTELYPPVIGGLEQHVCNLARALTHRGHTVSVATMRVDGRPRNSLDGDVRVHSLGGSVQRAPGAFVDEARPYAPPMPDPGLVRGLRRVIARERPHVVHAHNWLIHSFLPLKRGSGARLLLSLHDYSLVCAKKSLLFREEPCSGPGFRKCLGCASDHYGAAKGVAITLANWAMNAPEQRLVDMFVPVSASVAAGNDLAARGLPFEVISNFVPDDVAAPKPSPPGLIESLPGEPYLLFVGVLSRYKGVHVLLEAYARLQSAPPLVLIGPLGADMPAQLPAGVILLRDWPHEAVMEAFRRSMVAVVPSIYPDACPTVAMEAMATGTPVIASSIGGLPEIIEHGRTGILVPPADPASLASALTLLIKDARLRAEMAEAGTQRVEAFFASSIAGRMEGLYGRLLSDRTT